MTTTTMNRKQALQRYCEIRLQCEEWGLDENGSLFEALAWSLLGLAGHPTDSSAAEILNEALAAEGLPKYEDFRKFEEKLEKAALALEHED